MRHRSFAEQHPILLGLGILFAVTFVITYWPVFVAAVVAYGAFLGARGAVRCHRRRQRVHAAIAARADFEHAAVMRGDNLARHLRAVSTCAVVAGRTIRTLSDAVAASSTRMTRGH